MQQFVTVVVIVVTTIIGCLPLAQPTHKICMPEYFTVTGVIQETNVVFNATTDLENQLVYVTAQFWDLLIIKNELKMYTFVNASYCDWTPLRGYAFYERCIPEIATELVNPSEFSNQENSGRVPNRCTIFQVRVGNKVRIPKRKSGVRTWAYNTDPKTRIEMTLDENYHPLMTREIWLDNPNITDVYSTIWSNLKIGAIDESVFNRDVSNCEEYME